MVEKLFKTPRHALGISPHLSDLHISTTVALCPESAGPQRKMFLTKHYHHYIQILLM